MKSRGKSKTLYLHYQNGYGHKTYLEELRPIYLHKPLMSWLSKFTWQIKYIISPLAG